jgi:type IX secretion system PorP/SprF family membrane protein
MKPTINLALAAIVFNLIFFSRAALAQELNDNSSSESTYHNQLFFNRYLINPTFSLVRENKSYLNILHRNQYATFADNRQNYFLGFSSKLNENTAMGIGVYSQWAGVIQKFGFNANYATAVRMGDKSKLTFGTNITYFNEGLDRNRALVFNEDIALTEAKKESKLAIQPGMTLSVGNFDFGIYATDLLKYNQTTNALKTNFNEESVKAILQYNHHFQATSALFENARLMALAQLGKKRDGSLDYTGSLVLDMPNYGWLQTTYDNDYGMSMGAGFNLNKKLSLGYVLEKDISDNSTDLGWNHEVSLAYTYKTDNADDDLFANASQDQKIDGIVRNYEEQINNLLAEKEENERKHKIALKNLGVKKKRPYVNPMKFTTEEEIESLAIQNRLVLDELIIRQDSIESERTKQFEKRFEMMMRTVRNEIKANLKERIKEVNDSKSTRLALEENVKEVKKTLHEEAKPYKKLPFKVLGNSDMIGVKSGYYVIANVYKTKKYLKAFMNELKEKGLEAKQFYNKENGLYYVYLADYNFKEHAESAYVSNLNGQYKDEKWIMQVENHDAIVENMYID